jgi:hypothetical protein
MSAPSARFPAENWMWGLCLLSALVVLVPFTVLDHTPQPNLGMPTFLAVLSIAYSGTHLALLAGEGRKKLFSLTFWVFAYVWLGLVPLVQISTREFPWAGDYDNWAIAYSLTIVLVGYVAYDIGSWLGSLYYRKHKGRIVPYTFSLSKRRIYLLSLFAVVASLIAIQEQGGFDAVVGATRATLNTEVDPTAPKAGELIWSTLLRVPPFIALLTNWWIWLNRALLLTQRWQRALHVVVLLFLLTFNLAVNNPVSLNRFYLGTILFAFAAIGSGWSKRRSLAVWVAGLVAVLLILFPYADVFREEQGLVFEPVARQLTTNGDFDAFQQLTNTVVVVSESGITFGHQLLGALLFWVPRAFWHDKPVGSGQMVAEHLGYTFTNLSSPLWAEAYINAGLVGVVAILLLYGLVTSLLQQSYITSSGAQGLFIGGLVPVLAGFQFFFLRGDLQNGIAYVTPLVGCYLLTAKITRAPSHKKAPP